MNAFGSLGLAQCVLGSDGDWDYVADTSFAEKDFCRYTFGNFVFSQFQWT
ncbi:MAG: hypothetical protein ACRDAM_04995 [Casimicrobium sp.]